MAINKNFVVKNGLEVNTNLILADANSNKVGIASTAPRTELDVRGGIAATDLNITGVATIATLRATTGIVTNFDGVNLNVSGVGTIATFESTTSTIQNLNATNLDVSGIGTIGVGVVTNLSGTNLNYSGIGTVTTLTGTSVQISNLNATGVSTIASLSVTDSTFEILTVNQYTNLLGVTTIANATGTNLNFSGVGTFASIDINGGDLEVANLDATDINVTGVSTLGTFKISSGIITATSGVVTYYGDGSKLTNIVSGVGISSLGTLIGTGATILDFVGTALSTITISSGIATIKLDAGEGVTPGGSDGQVQYNGGGGFAASSNFTFDGSNVNIAGVVTATTFSGNVTGNLTGEVDAAAFDTNSSGILVTGIATATTFSGQVNAGVGTIGGVRIASGIITGTSGIVTYYGDGSGLIGVASTDNIQTSTPARFLDNVAISGITTVGTSLTITDSLLDGGVSLRILGQNLKVSGVATAQDFDSLSDINFKENVNTVDAALDKVNQLRGVSFNWKESGEASYGVIAQELESVLPELVHGDNPKRVNYNGIIGVLIESIKELSERVNNLENK